MYRKYPLVPGEVYHVFNKSIAGYEIFGRDSDYLRFLRLLRFYNLVQPPQKFSYYLNHDPDVKRLGFEGALHGESQDKARHVQIVSYCLMPTHFHMLASPLREDGMSLFMRSVLDGYSKYFNTKYDRKGVLWMGRFKNVIIENDEQLIHVVRYTHLNPTTAGIVKKPEDWEFSSYKEYVDPRNVKYPITEYGDLFDMSPDEHREFTEDQQDYQRGLAVIKNQILE